MAPPPKPRTAAFSDAQIVAGFWLIAATVHARSLEIDDRAGDPELEDALEGLVGAHGLKREHVLEAIPKIIAARRAAARKELPPVPAAKYDLARAAILRQRGAASSKGALLWPTASRTIAVRVGGGNWNDALIALGLPAGGRGRAQGSGRFNTEAMAAVLGEYTAWCRGEGMAPTFGGYGAWSAARRAEGRVDVPSAATVRQRCGTWSAALRLVDGSAASGDGRAGASSSQE
ncbi:MAG: hypothetical protein SPF88_06615 [Schaalia hyovaginalis]|uniref:hypothetical protein n=1 Tax=Schaalia hyovaginalis TaxID=29316 RepID=UPI0012B24DC2|nr:hypothetical protein [Schaalia hyovaginalis]MCI6557372.1 hypothetical protein [Schaalia hyovaginalis]MDY5601452.1 hypothetical protein [Schaalia hyovaginalis]MST63852.1 hypothetical protein [Schaalia hyovaginalis]